MVMVDRFAADVGVAAIGEVDALDHAQRREQVQGTEDGGSADPEPAIARGVDEVGGGEVAVVMGDELGDLAPRLRKPVAGAIEGGHQRDGISHGSLSVPWSRRRSWPRSGRDGVGRGTRCAARGPSATRNTSVSTSTIVAPLAASSQNDRYRPATAEPAPIITARPIILPNRTVSSWAAAAGVTSIATTRMIPTAWRLITIVSATRARNTYSTNPCQMRNTRRRADRRWRTATPSRARRRRGGRSC